MHEKAFIKSALIEFINIKIMRVIGSCKSKPKILFFRGFTYKHN